MKKNLFIISMILVFGLIFSIFTTTTTNAKIYAEEFTFKIKVIGEGQTCVKPDTANIKFAIKTTGEDLTKIETENTTKTNEIIAKLEEQNISKDNIKSISYSLYQRYEYLDSEQVNLGHEISNILEINTKNLDNITKIISTLTENGIEEIYAVSLSLEDSTSAYNTALSNALENAKQKAQTLANGQTLHVCKVMENNFNHSFLNMARFDAKTVSDENGLNKVLENEICVKANILVEFCSNISLNVDSNNQTQYNLNKESGNTTTESNTKNLENSTIDTTSENKINNDTKINNNLKTDTKIEDKSKNNTKDNVNTTNDKMINDANRQNNLNLDKKNDKSIKIDENNDKTTENSDVTTKNNTNNQKNVETNKNNETKTKTDTIKNENPSIDNKKLETTKVNDITKNQTNNNSKNIKTNNEINNINKETTNNN